MLCQDATGLTAMHWATARGRLLTVALLAAREADADSLAAFSEQQSTETCSDLAARYGHLGLAAFLGELQLQQGVLKLADRHLPGTSPVKAIESCTGIDFCTHGAAVSWWMSFLQSLESF